MDRPREAVISAGVAFLGCLILSAPGGVWSFTVFAIIGGLFAFPAVVLGFVEVRLVQMGWLRLGTVAQTVALCGVWVASGAIAFGLAWVGTAYGPSFSWWWLIAPLIAVLTTVVRGVAAHRRSTMVPDDR